MPIPIHVIHGLLFFLVGVFLISLIFSWQASMGNTISLCCKASKKECGCGSLSKKIAEFSKNKDSIRK